MDDEKGFMGMPKLGRKKEQPKPDRTHVVMTEREKAMLLVYVAAILFVAAIIAVAGSYIANAFSSGQLSVAKCNSYYLSSSKYACLAQLANTTKNASVCGFLPSQQGVSCVISVATLQRNITTCKRIVNNSPEYNDCFTLLAPLSGNYSNCAQLPESLGFRCLYNISQEHDFAVSQIAACRNVSSGFYSRECQYLIYYKAAVLQRNSTYCQNLEGSVNQTTMFNIFQNYSSIIRTANGVIFNPNATQGYYYATFNVTPMDFCYIALAKLENSTSLCDYVTTTEGKALCSGNYNASGVP